MSEQWRDLFVDADGVPLAVRDYGDNGPPVVLVHGHYGNLGDSSQVAPLLAEDFHVVAYDQRGHGWSEEGAVSVETYLADLDAVIAASGAERPLLVGSSF